MAKLNKANTCGSTSIIIPSKIIQQLGWKLGEDVVVHLNKDKTKIIIEKVIDEDI